jgi:hypothetical protein
MRCARKTDDGMRCIADGEWQPVLMMYAPFIHGNSSPVTAPLGLAVCQKHKQEATLDHFLSDEGWEQIAAGFDAIGRVVPDRKRTKLAWRKYGDIQAEFGCGEGEGRAGDHNGVKAFGNSIVSVMRSNCLFFVLAKWMKEGGYVVIRKSHSGWFPHFLWSPDLKTFLHFTPINRRSGKPLPPLFFTGYVREGEEE